MQELMGWRGKVVWKKMECLNRLYVKGLFLLRLNVLWKWMSWLTRNTYPPWYSKTKGIPDLAEVLRGAQWGVQGLVQPRWKFEWKLVLEQFCWEVTASILPECITGTDIVIPDWGMFPLSSIIKQKTCKAIPQAILIECSKWEPIRLPEST